MSGRAGNMMSGWPCVCRMLRSLTGRPNRMIGSVILIVSLICAAIVPNVSAQYDEESVVVLTVAREFFGNIEEKKYSLLWDGITEKSRKAVVNLVYEEQPKTGNRLTRAAIRKDFENCSVLCKSFWKGYFSAFDAGLALNQSEWDIGTIKRSKAEVLITHRNAESPAKLKMVRESGEWKVGFTETFWSFWGRRR